MKCNISCQSGNSYLNVHDASTQIGPFDGSYSIRKDSFFEQGNMSLEEIIKFVYWWTQYLTQTQIRNQLRTGSSTAVDWDTFCCEVCEIIIVEEVVPIGEPGRRVQIDASKIGKRKYHRGHYVEGQWIFGGIDEESR